jgi:hypothetical protein
MNEPVYDMLLSRGIQAEVQFPADTAIEIAKAIRGKGFRADTMGGRIGVTKTIPVPFSERIELRHAVGSMVVDHDGIVFSGFYTKKSEVIDKVLNAVITTLRQRCHTHA